MSMKKFGCTVPWMMNKSHICTVKDNAIKALNFFIDNKKNQKEICPKACISTNIYLNPPVTGDNWYGDKIASIMIYFKTSVKYSEEYYLQDIYMLIAQIGGIVGMMLGISLVNIRYGINKVIDLFCDR